jgi:hypothetical protein
LDFLADASKKMKIRILVYCVMDNHFHLVLENTSGKMSQCLTLEGKKHRGELLVLLKDVAGITYKEISEFDIFGDLRFNSLRGIYRSVKRKTGN